MSMRVLHTCRMKTMDKELKKHVRGLKPNQNKLLASIYLGLAGRLRRRKVNDSLKKWQSPEDYGNN